MDELFTIQGFKIDDLCHSGVKGQKWGIRRWQNPDGSLTPAGKEHYSKKYDQKGKKDPYHYSDGSPTLKGLERMHNRHNVRTMLPIMGTMMLSLPATSIAIGSGSAAPLIGLGASVVASASNAIVSEIQRKKYLGKQPAFHSVEMSPKEAGIIQKELGNYIRFIQQQYPTAAPNDNRARSSMYVSRAAQQQAAQQQAAQQQATQSMFNSAMHNTMYGHF